MDFRTAPETARGEINSWVEQAIVGKIKDMVAPGQLADYTRLVLCNAIYFKGKWQTQFKESDTKPGVFHVTTNETETVPMMRQFAEFKMAHSDDYAIDLLDLPYSGNDLSMIILLPQVEYHLANVEQPGLPDLEQKLTTENLHSWFAKLDHANPHKTSVCFPRFTATQSFELAKELKALGMPSAFNDTADFSGMDGTTNLFVSDVVHKAFVEVNEAGTEDAAATSVHVETKSSPGLFIVDHPFIFLIRDNGTGSILFLGRIVNPTK